MFYIVKGAVFEISAASLASLAIRCVATCGGLASTAKYGLREVRPSKLDPFKTYLQERIKAAAPHWIPAAVLYREISAQGFDGKEGIVKSYPRKFKHRPEDEPVRFETLPGQQMQVDFTTIRRGHSKIKGFVATLGYSRASYVRFSTHERQWLLEAQLHHAAGGDFEPSRSVAGCGSANAQIGQWLNEVAHQRIHGTTRQKPQTLLIHERLSLGSFPCVMR